MGTDQIDDDEVKTETTRLMLLAAIAMDKARRRSGLKKKEVAARMGVPPSRVTKCLDGLTNVTLRSLAAFGLACDEHFVIRLKKKETAGLSKAQAGDLLAGFVTSSLLSGSFMPEDLVGVAPSSLDELADVLHAFGSTDAEAIARKAADDERGDDEVEDPEPKKAKKEKRCAPPLDENQEACPTGCAITSKDSKTPGGRYVCGTCGKIT
jgi:hypothetical protein